MKWSHSKLSKLQSCSHKYYLNYVKGIWRDGNHFMKRGIAIHHAAKQGHKRQLFNRAQKDIDFVTGTLNLKGIEATNVQPEDIWTDPSFMEEMPGTDKSLQEARDITADSFEKEWEKGTLIPYGEDAKKLKAKTKDCAVDMGGHYIKEYAKVVVPAAVERYIEVPIPGTDAILNGYVDLIQEDGGEVITDLKSAEKAPKFEAEGEQGDNENIHYGKGPGADLSNQLTLYTLMRWADVKKKPVSARLVTIVRTPVKAKMSVYKMETERTKEDMQRTIAKFKKAIELHDAGVFMPADQGGWNSPCGNCEFADGTCEYVRKRGVK